MALTIRNQASTLFNPLRNSVLLPQSNEFLILIYLSIKDLDKAMLVSRYWYYFINDNKRWKNAHKDRDAIEVKEMQRRLLKAVQSNQFNRVYRYINIGAKAEFNIAGCIDRQFNFTQRLGVARTGHFVNPTLLSVAVNVAYEYEGAKIVSLLLMHGANPLITSEYHDYASSAGDNHGYAPVIEHKGRELPITSARDDTIKSLIGFTVFEKELMESDDQQKILRQLALACETDTLFVKEYLVAFAHAEHEFKGVRYTLPIEKRDALKSNPEFSNLYIETTSPGYFKQYWSWLAGTLFFSFQFFCYKYAAMAALTSNIIGLFTTIVLPTAVCAGIGSLAMGLIAIGCIFLIKLIKDYLIKPDNPHFPLVLDDSNRVSKYSGALFPKHCIDFLPTDINKPTLCQNNL